MRTAAVVMPYFLWLCQGHRLQLAGEQMVDDNLPGLYSAEFNESLSSRESGAYHPLKALAVLLFSYQGPAAGVRLTGRARKLLTSNPRSRGFHLHWSARSFLRAAAPVSCACQRALSDLSDDELKDELTARGFDWRANLREKLAELRTSQGPVPPAPDEAKIGAGASSCCQPPASDVVAPSPAPDISTASSFEDPEEMYQAAYRAEFQKVRSMDLNDVRMELKLRGVRWIELPDKAAHWRRLAELRVETADFSASGVLMPGVVGKVTGEQLRKEMADGGTPLLVDVFATWCGPCKMIAPKLDEVARKAGDRLRVAKLDSDAESQLSAELRVTSFPTVIFMQSGKEVYRLQGVPEQDGALEALVAQHLRLQL